MRQIESEWAPQRRDRLDGHWRLENGAMVAFVLSSGRDGRWFRVNGKSVLVMVVVMEVEVRKAYGGGEGDGDDGREEKWFNVNCCLGGRWGYEASRWRRHVRGSDAEVRTAVRANQVGGEVGQISEAARFKSDLYLSNCRTCHPIVPYHTAHVHIPYQVHLYIIP